MSNLLCWVKGLGVVIGGVIAFSGNSAITKISQNFTLPNNDLNTSKFDSSMALEKHNISEDNALKFNYSNDQTQIQDKNTVEKQKDYNLTKVISGKKNILLAGCYPRCF
ncbi:hypothetical protein WKK05_11505 [Nostoc sp. UHCC 0302]|uniref:hypothetical protein n=1 Tax=Nostoc sp. UHCC 0302 TaxID=3134896 RepID=UPI00311CA748